MSSARALRGLPMVACRVGQRLFADEHRHERVKQQIAEARTVFAARGERELISTRERVLYVRQTSGELRAVDRGEVPLFGVNVDSEQPSLGITGHWTQQHLVDTGIV